MNWKNVYLNIIESAKNKNRSKLYDEEYYENHHIIPRSVFASNLNTKILDLNLEDVEDDSNLVLLTAREHFFCHVLLVDIFKENKDSYYSMLCAFSFMSSRFSIRNNRMYERLRKEFCCNLRNFLQNILEMEIHSMARSIL